MKWLFRLAFRGQYHQIQHMRGEIEWLRGQMTYERDRADKAVDQLLMWKANVNAIAPAKPSQTTEAMEGALASMFRSPEMMAMGDPAGIDG